MDLTTFMKQLYVVDKLEGYSEEEINRLKEMYGALPDMLEDFYRSAGKTPALNCGQDTWIMPQHREKWSWLAKSSHFILLNENQGVCRAGIRLEDMDKPDPPVYVCMNDKDWKLCAPATSEFLAAALAYEAVFTFDYSPEEFYWLSKEDMELVESELTKLSCAMQNWITISTTCYYNAPDNMAVVMDCGDEYQMIYGGATEESYNKLRSDESGIILMLWLLLQNDIILMS